MPIAADIKKLARADSARAADELARVDAVDELAATCDVTTARTGLELKGLPLRVLNLPGDAGIYAIPAVGSDVRISYDGSSPGRPRLEQVQEFDRLVLKKASGLKVEITKDDLVIMGNEARATHPAALGDKVEERIAALEAKFNVHVHGLVTPGTGSSGPPTSQASGQPKFNSPVVTIE